LSVLTPEELERKLQHGDIHPAYLLVGPEEFIRRQAVLNLKSALVDSRVLDFNWDEFAGPKASANRILGVLRTLPVMSPRRGVLVTQAEELAPADQEQLIDYLIRPNPRSTLIIVTDELDRRMSFYRSLKEHAQVVEFPKLKGNALAAWAGDYIRRKGRSISSTSLNRLVDLAGADLQTLIGEIEKLLLYAGQEKVIHPQAVEQMVQGSRQHSIFELTDALGRRDRRAALRSLGNLLESGEHPLIVLTMMARHFRQVLIAKEMIRSGHTPHEIGQAAQIPAFLLDNFLRQARSIDQSIAERVYTRLGEIDLRIKTSSANERTLLESLIYTLPGQPT
jgi:DNA polymerase-3 subunit delta